MALEVSEFLLCFSNSGKVLVAGGITTGTTRISNAEIYDPSTGTSSATASMSAVRSQQITIKLSNGKVLMAGGHSGAGIIATAQVFDPSLET